jgi:hypothetical protein
MVYTDIRAQNEREQKAGSRRRSPPPTGTSSAGGLVIGDDYRALGRAGACPLKRLVVRGTYLGQQASRSAPGTRERGDECFRGEIVHHAAHVIGSTTRSYEAIVSTIAGSVAGRVACATLTKEAIVSTIAGGAAGRLPVAT